MEGNIEAITDKRFLPMAKAKRFKGVRPQKVKVDKRFDSMFSDPRFGLQLKHDARGRPLDARVEKLPDMRTFYKPPSDDDSDDDELFDLKEDDKKVVSSLKKPVEKEGGEEDVVLHDFARGEGNVESSSSDDDSDSDDSMAAAECDWVEEENQVRRTDDTSRRLAACNLDWENVSAQDLFVIFQSFIPAGGHLKQVTVYLSEFGKERAVKERQMGPDSLGELAKFQNEHLKKGMRKANFDSGKMSRKEKQIIRKYELDKLKYYYALAEFDSPNSADTIYKALDGREYQNSTVNFDLRFVPDDMTFDEADVRDRCDRLPSSNEQYEPVDFSCAAMATTNPNITWDKKNRKRERDFAKVYQQRRMTPQELRARSRVVRAQRKKHAELTLEEMEACISNYIASGSSAEDEDDDGEREEGEEEFGERGGESAFGEGEGTTGIKKKKSMSKAEHIAKYRSLLASLNNNENSNGSDAEHQRVDMEDTWDADSERKLNEAFDAHLQKKRGKKTEKNGDWDRDDDALVSDDDGSYNSDLGEIPKMQERKNRKPKKAAKKDAEIDDETKANLELLVMDEEDGKKHYNLERPEKKKGMTRRERIRYRIESKQREKEMDDNFKINLKDERFAAMFTSGDYSLEPTNPRFRKTKAMQELFDEKIRRLQENSTEVLPTVADTKRVSTVEKINADMTSIAKDLKRKMMNVKTKTKIKKN